MMGVVLLYGTAEMLLFVVVGVVVIVGIGVALVALAAAKAQSEANAREWAELMDDVPFEPSRERVLEKIRERSSLPTEGEAR